YAGEVDPELIDLLRADLTEAEYSSEAVTVLWGARAERARQRGVLAPARRELADRETSPLAVLARAFLLGESVSEHDLDFALPRLGASGAAELGLVNAGDGYHRTALSLNPVH